MKFTNRMGIKILVLVVGVGAGGPSFADWRPAAIAIPSKFNEGGITPPRGRWFVASRARARPSPQRLPNPTPTLEAFEGSGPVRQSLLDTCRMFAVDIGGSREGGSRCWR